VKATIKSKVIRSCLVAIRKPDYGGRWMRFNKKQNKIQYENKLRTIQVNIAYSTNIDSISAAFLSKPSFRS
jgi:hypothetical protein